MTTSIRSRLAAAAVAAALLLAGCTQPAGQGQHAQAAKTAGIDAVLPLQIAF